MRQITNITDEPIQRHILNILDDDITIVLRFLPVSQIWVFASITYKTTVINGVKLSVGVQHINGANLPFDFYCTDASQYKIDPFAADDFSTARNKLYVLEPTDLEQIRGYAVEF